MTSTRPTAVSAVTADVSARVLELRRNVVALHTKTPKPPTEGDAS